MAALPITKRNHAMPQTPPKPPPPAHKPQPGDFKVRITLSQASSSFSASAGFLLHDAISCTDPKLINAPTLTQITDFIVAVADPLGDKLA